ncbi:MAG: LON peptidase substrate-binding domain-containing protein, partial [Acidimicrobiia bacterium]
RHRDPSGFENLSRVGVVLRQSIGAEHGYHQVGTAARITGKQSLAGERSILMALGERRFEIVEILDDDPYPLAAIRYLTETGGSPEAVPLRDRVVSALRKYLALSAEGGEGGNILIEVSEDPAAASFQVASLMRLSSPEHQELLEAASVEERLRRELAVLEQESGLLRRLLNMGRL